MGNEVLRLANRMRASKTIAFVGAGASASVGYPTWNQLLDGLYQRAKATSGAAPPDVEQDMRWIAEQFDVDLAGSLMDAVREVFETYGPQGPGRLHELLVRLPFNHFITTNYDRLIEDACLGDTSGGAPSDSTIPAVQSRIEACIPRSGRDHEQFSTFLAMLAEDSGRRAVLHLHGTLEDQLTLTMTDYNRQYLHEASMLRMFAIFATSTVVFVGASLRDPDVMELVRRAHFHSGPKARHFAFLPDTRRNDGPLLERNYGIQTIFYRWSPREGHGDLLRRLEQLLELVDEGGTWTDHELASGNVRGSMKLVMGDIPYGFDRVVDRVKDELRRADKGVIAFCGLGSVAASRVLRRIAADYAALPGHRHFSNVVWISPRRIGFFPGEHRARTVLEGVVGEVVAALGAHRVTATPDHSRNLKAIERLLASGGSAGSGSTLFVFDAVDELRKGCTPEERKTIRGFLDNLPDGSIAVMEREKSDGTPQRPKLTAHRTEIDLDRLNELRLDPSWIEPLEDERLAPIENDTVMQRILLGLSILATSVDSATLAGILDLNPIEVEAAAADLADDDLIEVERLPEPPPTGTSRPARERIPDQGLGRLEVSSPIREAVLVSRCRMFMGTDAAPGVAADVVQRLVSWGRSKISSLHRWEADEAQFIELVQQLPLLVSIFESGAWFRGESEKGGFELEQRWYDTWLWLGADLGYILPNAGRWAEATSIVESVWQHRARTVDAEALTRELLILESRISGHLATDRDDIAPAKELAAAALESAEKQLADLEGGDDQADRAALELHRDRARIRLGQIHYRLQDYDGAIAELEQVYESAFAEGATPPSGRRLKFAADAAGWLAEAMRRRLEDPNDRVEVAKILRVLDDGFESLVRLGNKRDRGMQAMQRGELLLDAGNPAAARRSLARAFLASIEFRDRYLEARALLGLARTDRRRSLARRAESILVDVFPPDLDWAQDLRYALPSVEPRLGDLPTRPLLLMFVGLPGTGKTVAMRTAKQQLTEWGWKPSVLEFEPTLIERWRRRAELDLDEVHEALDRRLAEHDHETAVVVLARAPIAGPGELLGKWGEGDPILNKILCVHLMADPDVLRARNRERHGEGVPEPSLRQHIERASNEQLPEPHASWESWLEVRGASYVKLRSDTPIRVFQNAVEDALALSYVPVERLRTII